MLADWLWRRRWWSYAHDPSAWGACYHWMNVLEGVAWLLCGLFVLVRFWRRRNSAWECAYAAAFFVFGLSDFYEAYALDSWLILAKGINLALLLWLRATIRGRYYPDSRIL